MSRASRHVARFHERRTRTKSSLFSGCQISFPRWFWFLGGFFGGFKKKIRPKLGGFREIMIRSSWTPQRVHFSHLKVRELNSSHRTADSKPPNSSRSCRLVHQIHLVPPRPWSRSSSGPCWHWHELEAMEFVRGIRGAARMAQDSQLIWGQRWWKFMSNVKCSGTSMDENGGFLDQCWTNWEGHLFGNRWNKLEQRQFVTQASTFGKEISM